MIAHVAEASEGSGRVLLWLDPGALSAEMSCDAAVRIAQAYSAEVETIVIDGPCAGDVEDIPAAFVPFVRTVRREIARDRGRNARALMADRQRRSLERLASRRNVAFSHASAGGDAIDALADMCLARGPWNIVAVAGPPSSEMPALLATILANVSGATGVVVGGSGPASTSHDVAVVIEDAERLPSMIRAAERLTSLSGTIRILISAETVAMYGELEAVVRLTTSGLSRCEVCAGGPDYGVTGTLEESLVNLRPGFVVARFGGNLLGETRALTRLLAIARAPFLLVR